MNIELTSAPHAPNVKTLRTAAKTEYQLYLKQQIEDRAAEKEREKERLREEDEKEANRVEAERLRIKQG